MARGHTSISPLISSPQSLTSNWANIGNLHDCFGFTVLGLYIKVKVNDSQDVRLRILTKINSEDPEVYTLPISIETLEKNIITEQYIEFEVDEDKTILVFFSIEAITPYFQVQVQAGFTGATAAQIEKIYYCLGDK